MNSNIITTSYGKLSARADKADKGGQSRFFVISIHDGQKHRLSIEPGVVRKLVRLW